MELTSILTKPRKIYQKSTFTTRKHMESSVKIVVVVPRLLKAKDIWLLSSFKDFFVKVIKEMEMLMY